MCASPVRVIRLQALQAIGGIGAVIANRKQIVELQGVCSTLMQPSSFTFIQIEMVLDTVRRSNILDIEMYLSVAHTLGLLGADGMRWYYYMC